jgi:hypothetical protein
VELLLFQKEIAYNRSISKAERSNEEGRRRCGGSGVEE